MTRLREWTGRLWARSAAVAPTTICSASLPDTSRGRRAPLPGTVAFMLLVAGLAALGPARRGLRIDPTEALRSE